MLFQALTLAAFAGKAFADFSIATPPTITQCQPVSISWTDGQAPFILSAIPAGQTTAEPLLWINDNLSGSPYTWIVNLPVGTAITLKISDATGANTYSSPLNVMKGSSDSCMNVSSSAAAPSGTAPASESSAPAESSTAAASSSAAASSAPASSSAVASTPSASAAPTGSSASAAPPKSSFSSAGTASAAHTTAATTAAPKPNNGAMVNFVAIPAIAAAVAGALLF